MGAADKARGNGDNGFEHHADDDCLFRLDFLPAKGVGVKEWTMQNAIYTTSDVRMVMMKG